MERARPDPTSIIQVELGPSVQEGPARNIVDLLGLDKLLIAFARQPPRREVLAFHADPASKARSQPSTPFVERWL